MDFDFTGFTTKQDVPVGDQRVEYPKSDHHIFDIELVSDEDLFTHKPYKLYVTCTFCRSIAMLPISLYDFAMSADMNLFRIQTQRLMEAHIKAVDFPGYEYS